MQQVCTLPFASPSAFLTQQYISPVSRELLPIALDQHASILDAIANREGSRAEGLAREHARIARRNLEAVLQDRELLRQLPGGKLIAFPPAH